MTPAINGYLQDGRTSATVQARLTRIDPEQVVLEWEDGRASYRIDQLRGSARLGNTPRHLTLPDGLHFETADNDAVDLLLQRRGDNLLWSWLHQMESSWRYVAPALIVTVLFVWTLIQYGLPAAANGVATRLPIAAATGLSDRILGHLDRQFFAPSQLPAATSDRLRRCFGEITAPSTAGFNFQLLFRRGGKPLGANAFALPSGLIVMTDELVQLAEQEEELVAVMAHELGHVVHRHGLRQALQHTALGLIVTYLTADASSLIGALPLVLVKLGYSRDFEQEADLYALRLLRANKIPTRHFADLMLRLEEKHHDGSADNASSFGHYLSTHPATATRIKPFLAEAPEPHP